MDKRTIKDRLPEWSMVGLAGALVPALISLGIFATKADVAELRAEAAEKYVSQKSLDTQISRIETVLIKINDKLDRLAERTNRR